MLLADIVANKQQEVLALKELYRGKDLANFAHRLVPPRNFLAAFPADKISLIAEIKKASPSIGDINVDIKPASLAATYQEAGAAAISILTDKKFFKGKLEDLIAVKQATTIPVLRKDFILDEAQVYESRIAGADAVLLIVRILGQENFSQLLKLTKSLGMQALVETHNEQEVELALSFGASVIGINNRDLNSLEIDINTTLNLLKKFPELKNRVLVSESGIETREQVKLLHSAGVRAVLVGTSLLKSQNISAKINELLS